MHLRSRALLASVLALAMGWTGGVEPASAQDPASFYKGKTVKFIVGVAVGGGFDAYARMIAPHLAKTLESTVVVENVIGAGGLVALNQMMLPPADGLRLHIVNGTPSALAQLLDQENVRYDLTKMDHLGVVAAEPWVMLVGNHVKATTVADLLSSAAKVRWGGTGPTGGPSDGASITCEALKMPCQVVLGYRGSAEIALAVERGELDALYVTDASGLTYDRTKQARIIAVASRERSKLVPEVPTVFEAVKLTKEQEWWLDFRIALNNLGRILVTTPGTPSDRLEFLRAAIKKVLTDPEVIAEGAKSQRDIDYRDPESARQTAIKAIGQITPEQKAIVRDVVLKRYQ